MVTASAPGHWKQAALIVGAVVIFGLTLPRLGMAFALPMLVGVGSLASGEFHWREVLINALVLTIGCWLVFIKGLGLTIPLWPVFLAA
jgi:ABC-type multidrug transport system permease subunit